MVAAARPATKPPEELLELLHSLDPVIVVVGIPLSMDGSEGPMAVEARQFGAALGHATGVQIEEWDERLTTARAERELRQMSSASRRREKGKSDMIAASLLLQSFLRSREQR